MQERIDKLARPEHFRVSLFPVETLYKELSHEELARLLAKLELVEEIALALAANMVKGTLKYNTDDRSMEQWLDYATDDAMDTVNYLFLLRQAIAKDKNRLVDV